MINRPDPAEMTTAELRAHVLEVAHGLAGHFLRAERIIGAAPRYGLRDLFTLGTVIWMPPGQGAGDELMAERPVRAFLHRDTSTHQDTILTWLEHPPAGWRPGSHAQLDNTRDDPRTTRPAVVQLDVDSPDLAGDPVVHALLEDAHPMVSALSFIGARLQPPAAEPHLHDDMPPLADSFEGQLVDEDTAALAREAVAAVQLELD